eukprot:gene15734-17319_t
MYNRCILALLLLAAIAYSTDAAFDDNDELLEELSKSIKKDPAMSSNSESSETVKKEENTPPLPSTCKDVGKQCIEDSQAGKCVDKNIRKICPRSCMTCCADIDSTMCAGFKKMCFGVQKERLARLCPETCGHCSNKMPAPAPCMQSKYGCCWDKSTFAAGPIGSGTENCPPCKNVKSDTFCNRFASDCYAQNKDKGKQMLEFCPKTCHVCGASKICRDVKIHKYQCPQYKADGLCEASPKTMRAWCAGTCGFCQCPRRLQDIKRSNEDSLSSNMRILRR